MQISNRAPTCTIGYSETVEWSLLSAESFTILVIYTYQF